MVSLATHHGVISNSCRAVYDVLVLFVTWVNPVCTHVCWVISSAISAGMECGLEVVQVHQTTRLGEGVAPAV